MIKLLAVIFMLIDHIGLIFFPNNIIPRIIGRLSMPLFAYCIARGFFYSEKKGTSLLYAKRMMIFAVISQIPFTILSLWIIGAFRLNIGVTWFLSICMLKFLASEAGFLKTVILVAAVGLIALVLPIDYGLYGVMLPIVFYFFMMKQKKELLAFVGIAALFILYRALGGGSLQIFSFAYLPVLLAGLRFDDRVQIKREFFYAFYPCHITALLLLKAIL